VAPEVKEDGIDVNVETLENKEKRGEKCAPTFRSRFPDHLKEIQRLEKKDRNIYEVLRFRIDMLYNDDTLPALDTKKLELRSDWDVKVKKDFRDFFNLLDTVSKIMELPLPDSTKQYFFYYSLVCIEPVWNETDPAKLKDRLKEYLKKKSSSYQ